MKRLLLPTQEDDCRFPLLSTLYPETVTPSPIWPIAQQDPEAAVGLIDRMNCRQAEVDRQRDLIQGTAAIVGDHAAVIAAAVRSRSDRDHFLVTTTAGSCKEGIFFNTDRRVFGVTTRLDMW
jgi:hypothetical protein